jgi:hypothetical protein
VPPEHCCDLCSPSVFDRVRPGKAAATKRKVNIKRGIINEEVRDSLYSWQKSIKHKHYPTSIFAPHAILDDDSCDLLASVGPIQNKEFLARVIEHGWAYWDRHRGELFNWLGNQTIPPLQPLRKPPKPASATLKPSTSQKRAAEQFAVPTSTPTSHSSSANKRPRLEAHPAPNPSNYTPMAIPPHIYTLPASSRTPTSWNYAIQHQHQIPSLSASGSQASTSMHHSAPPTQFSSPQFMMGPQGFIPSNHLSSTERFGRFSVPLSTPSHPMPLSSHAYSTPTTAAPSPSLLLNLGLTADFRTPAPRRNVLFQSQFLVPMDLDPDFDHNPPIVPSQGSRDQDIP